ncbi:MAG: S-layer homology domain-containing protein, partial [Bacteroidales bacterium]
MSTKIKRPTSFLLILCVVLSLFAGSAYAAHRYFEDAKGHWAEEAINILAEKGVIAGYPDGLVHPDNIITRAEFATLIARTMELPKSTDKDITIHFTDIPGHWSESDVEALVIAGIIQKGDFSNKFLPDEPITRMEMIRMLVRAMGKENHDPSCPCMLGFLDESQLNEEQKAYICTGKHYHIIDGYPDGTVRPDKNATRGEAFEMLVDTEKAKEQIKNEEPEKPSVTEPEEKSSGSGGSSYVPTPQFSFLLPETAYTTDEIEVKPNSRYVSSILWTV